MKVDVIATAKALTKTNKNKAQTKMVKKQIETSLKSELASGAVSMFDKQAYLNSYVSES